MINHPAIGIRPLIDGRQGGVRESLEDKTMELADNVKKLLTENLRYADGTPVQVVLADGTIGGAAQSAACAQKFRAHNVGAELTVTASWNYVTEVLDLDPSIPHAIWGFNGTERPGAVTVAAAQAAYTQLGIPAFSIYGHDVQDAEDTGLTDDVVRMILKWARAALAVGQMRGRSYLAMGTVSMGIAGCRVPETALLKYLGIKTEYIDMIEFDRRIQNNIFDAEEYAIAREWVRKNCVEGENFNPENNRFSAEEYETQWDYITKMTLIANDLMHGNPKLKEMGYPEEAMGHDAICAGFQGQRQWTDYKPNGDLLETILNTSFDWNGKRQPSILATEGDSLNGLTMLFNHLLTNRSQLFSDVRTYWSPEAVKRVTGYTLTGRAENGFVDLRNSGATCLDGACGARDADGNPTIKPWWEMTDKDIDADLKATTFHAATKEYFPGGGFSTHFTTPGDVPVTAARLNYVDGVGLTLQISEGWTVMLPDEVRDTIVNRTDRTWPTTFFVPRLTGEGAHRSVYNWMDNWGANHTATGYGHFGDELITLASMLRIPVYMHNVEVERIFRPRAWANFGTSELESADFRACANFGSLYR